ncbi:hypothetical protein ACPZMI_00450 [Pseudomonas wayambapalatensis]|uniref:hypothetical protein n=1 Tax=Pseudomonas wayambapalatensis TaxID=485895 RepID=UPI003CEF5E47
MSAPQNHMATAPCLLRGGIAFGHSETGPVRQHNEDHFLIDPHLQRPRRHLPGALDAGPGRAARGAQSGQHPLVRA